MDDAKILKNMYRVVNWHYKNGVLTPQGTSRDLYGEDLDFAEFFLLLQDSNIPEADEFFATVDNNLAKEPNGKPIPVPPKVQKAKQQLQKDEPFFSKGYLKVLLRNRKEGE